MKTLCRVFAALGFVCLVATSVQAQVDPKLFSDMRWREIGPLRGGRTRALAGVPSEPATFYMGAVGGGVWKTTDAGVTWHSIWNDEPSGSIGSIAVSLSDPNVVYVGSGEGLQRPDLSTGDGVYKSTDGGKSWTHLESLRDTQQIGQVAIDPHDPNRVFVAAEGHPFGPSEERGLYRTTDGGKTFKRILFVSNRTGASEVQIDPQNPRIVFAGMWQRQEAPWENGSFLGSEGGLYRSTDGGDTWTKLTGNGLPDQILQVQLTISPTNPKRIYGAIAPVHGAVGLYRSDDGGDHWVHAPVDDTRPEERIGGGDCPVPVVDPRDPDTVYIASIVSWKSTDAGKTWTALRGSPGGDDYQNVWVNPNNTKIIALASDQGVVISQNGGESWAEWYNQATAQMYHATADNAFPYRVCGGQQDSGSACVPSRSDDGRITFHDWHPVGIEEYGYAAPDPLDPDIVYGGKVTRYNRRTGQIQNVEPKPLRSYRVLRTEPLQFSPVDPHRLYFATNTLWMTEDAGKNWKEVSPDLTRETWDLPQVVSGYKESPAAAVSRRGVIYALGLSPVDGNRIWAGTDDGLIWTTSDAGAHWDNVTPPALKPFWKVFNMDAGHFDAQTAYAAVNTMRLDDMRPHLFRTHDGGRNWTEIDNGIPEGAATSAIREDPKRQGLLYAGSETQVYVSFDDGDHWQSLRLNMPASSVRDLEVKGDDLIAATHGRGFLIVDDVTPLRQLAATTDQKDAYLYAPQTAIRIRNDMNPPTPWPADFPSTSNPPDGAVIDYYLGPNSSGVVSLEIADSKGQTVARFNSNDPTPAPDPRYPDPPVWERPPRVLSAAPGHHRFLWDLEYPLVPGMATSPDDDLATPHNTPQVSTAPWVMPGDYTVRLIVNGKTQSEPLKVQMDPRVKTTMQDLEQQFTLAKQMYDDLMKATAALHEISVLREQLKARKGQPVVGQAAPTIDSRLDAIAGPERGGRGFGRGPAGPSTLASVRMQIARLEHSIESADEAPTAAQAEAFQIAEKPLGGLIDQWRKMKETDLKSLNADLRKQHLAVINLDTHELDRGRQDQLEMGDEE
ncbi:MAG TPA: glycoside hydrolase [Terracidiphilus sp.]|jgi:photosystem II stability/assembly factor-like uncharacterized protein